MSVIETLTADPHRECRDRVDALTGMLASLYVLACVDGYSEVVDFVTRRRLSDVEISELYTRLEAAERAGSWYLADPQTLADMRLPVQTVILDHLATAWQLHRSDEGLVWHIAGSAQWWTPDDPAQYGPVFPVQIIHNPKETK